MGKASRKKRDRRGAPALPAEETLIDDTVVDDSMSDDPETIASRAMARLMHTNTPRNPSLAACYAVGYMALALAQQEGTAPHWYRDADPLDLLFLGTGWPMSLEDASDFALARDAWLRLLRDTVHGRGIRRFVEEVVALSTESDLPVDDGYLMLTLAGRLEAAGLDRRRLPRRLLPDQALRDCRALRGPDPDLDLPEPPEDAKARVKRFWKAEPGSGVGDTPQAVLRDGLRRLHDLGMPVKRESGFLLPALYAQLMTKPGEPLEDMGEQACAWALSLDEASALVPVLDVLLVAPDRGMTVAETLGHLFALPAFTEPIPSDALLWTGSPGLALPRMAFELGIPEVSTLERDLTPDMLDWAGMHARMRLATAARNGGFLDADETDEADEADEAEVAHETDGVHGAHDEPHEAWAARRAAVRGAVTEKIRKKAGDATPVRRPSDHPVERIWNADGSSVIRFSGDTTEGKEAIEAFEGQLDYFREKFGREPAPEDPLFFDPDADEPTPLTKERFDSMLLDLAERVADEGMDPAPLHAWREVGYIVTEETRNGFTAAEVIAFNRALARHRAAGA
ncbi:hypothetical protein [Streptomyces sp. NPDC059071]|uniref:hypothetical protein n=1 Tax=unclassified Streptomyces TaxID=2593676 RepID=UPI0036480457